jgi:hypothetical protein
MVDERTDEELKELSEGCYGEMFDPTNETHCKPCSLQPRCLHLLAHGSLDAISKEMKRELDAIGDGEIAASLGTTAEAIGYARLYRANPKIGLPVVDPTGALKPRLQVVHNAPETAQIGEQIVGNLPPPETEASLEVQKLLAKTEENVVQKSADDQAAKAGTGGKSKSKAELLCGHCGQKFKSKSGLSRHINAKHDGQPAPVAEEAPAPVVEAKPTQQALPLENKPGFVVNLTTGEAERASWGAFPAVMQIGDTPVFQLVFWSVPLNGWVYLVARATNRELPEGVYELTPEDLGRAEAMGSGLGLGAGAALQKLVAGAD